MTDESEGLIVEARRIAEEKSEASGDYLYRGFQPSATLEWKLADRLEAAERASAAGQANNREAWAALAMIREVVEQQTVGAMPASEHLMDPCFTAEATAIIGGVHRLTAALAHREASENSLSFEHTKQNERIAELEAEVKAARGRALADVAGWHDAEADKLGKRLEAATRRRDIPATDLVIGDRHMSFSGVDRGELRELLENEIQMHRMSAKAVRALQPTEAGADEPAIPTPEPEWVGKVREKLVSARDDAGSTIAALAMLSSSCRHANDAFDGIEAALALLPPEPAKERG